MVALWSLLTLGSSPRGVATASIPRTSIKKAPLRKTTVKKAIAKNAAAPQPLPSNRFMKQRLEADLNDEDVSSELPADHVSRSRVRILKTLEPDPELETPAFKPTTYDQIVKSQRVPKTSLPKAHLPQANLSQVSLPKVNLPRTGLPTDSRHATDSLQADLPRPTREVTAPKLLPRETASQPRAVQPPLATPPRAPLSPRRIDAEDTSTQPSLFEAGKTKRPDSLKLTEQEAAHPEPVDPEPALLQVPAEFRLRQPSVQREESEAAFRGSQNNSQEPNSQDSEISPKPKTQREKDEAFKNFLRKNDDLGF